MANQKKITPVSHGEHLQRFRVSFSPVSHGKEVHRFRAIFSPVSHGEQVYSFWATFYPFYTVSRFTCFAPGFLPLSRMSRSSTETCLALRSARGSCREIQQGFLAPHTVDWLLERSRFHQLLNEFVQFPVSRRKGITKLFGIRVSGIRLCLQEQGAGARGGGVSSLNDVWPREFCRSGGPVCCERIGGWSAREQVICPIPENCSFCFLLSPGGMCRFLSPQVRLPCDCSTATLE